MRTGDFLRGRRRDQLSDAEQAALEGAVSEVKRLPARTMLVTKGDIVAQSTLLLEGLMCRYMDDRNGYRQIVALQVAGDFVDLHGYPLRRLDHDVATISPCTVALVPHAALTELTETFPHLGRMLWFSTLLDAAMHREWIFRLGRLDAAARLTHLLLETYERLRAVGRTRGNTFDLALTQIDIAEAAGLTPVHVNRMLAKLRKQGVLEVRSGTVTIRDMAAAVRLAEFDRGYLYIQEEPTVP